MIGLPPRSTRNATRFPYTTVCRSLSPAQYEQWVIAPNAEIVRRLKALHPDTPVIGFPKGAGGKLRAYADETGVDAIGIDETVDPVWADAALPAHFPVQGNLDPLALVAGGGALDAAIDRILAAFPDSPHLFNLGHGNVRSEEHTAE